MAQFSVFPCWGCQSPSLETGSGNIQVHITLILAASRLLLNQTHLKIKNWESVVKVNFKGLKEEFHLYKPSKKCILLILYFYEKKNAYILYQLDNGVQHCLACRESSPYISIQDGCPGEEQWNPMHPETCCRGIGQVKCRRLHGIPEHAFLSMHESPQTASWNAKRQFAGSCTCTEMPRDLK